MLEEAVLGWCALVLVHLDEPHLCAGLQFVGCHPNLFFGCDPLLVEVGLIAVDERERVRLAIILEEVELLEPGRAVVVVVVVA